VGPRTGLNVMEKRNIRPCRESNPGCPARSLSRRHGHRSDKNRVYSTSHLFFTCFFVFNCFIYACLLLKLNPVLIERMVFPRQRALRMDSKENTTLLLPTGRCLATDPAKKRITSLLGRCLVTGPDPKENANAA
jgi:hypothetical protein